MDLIEDSVDIRVDTPVPHRQYVEGIICRRDTFCSEIQLSFMTSGVFVLLLSLSVPADHHTGGCTQKMAYRFVLKS